VRSGLWRLLLVGGLAVAVGSGCHSLQIPMAQEWYRQGHGHDQLIVFLRGLGDDHRIFQREGIVDEVWAHGLEYDMVAPNAHLGYYRAENVDVRLKEDVIEPAKAMGYRKIWLVGVSMGGLGACFYAKRYPQDLAGVVLISPFLGYEGIRAEVARAGGLRRWEPGPQTDQDWERTIWAWLKAVTARPADYPPIYLGRGTDDYMKDGHLLLAAALPAGSAVEIPGGHRLKTFKAAWEKLLAQVPF
jgi:pimeloyl-ACP methyl ester carboxylesterase